MSTNLKLSEMLESFQKVKEQIDPGLFISALLAALAAAVAASLMYRFFYERRGTGSQVHRAFPLLAISITTLFIGVQVSIPLSLGLLGSLSIIRFRTPIKEPEEVGFIMLVIAASISAATFHFEFMVMLYVAAFFALLVMRGGAMCKWLKRDGLLVIALPSVGAGVAMEAIDVFLRASFARHTLECASVRDGVATYQYVFSGMKIGVSEFNEGLSGLADITSVNLFLDRPGGIR